MRVVQLTMQLKCNGSKSPPFLSELNPLWSLRSLESGFHNYDRYDHCDRWTFLFSAIATIVAIKWKPGFNREAAAKKSDQKTWAVMRMKYVHSNVLLMFFFFTLIRISNARTSTCVSKWKLRQHKHKRKRNGQVRSSCAFAYAYVVA